MNKHYQVGKQYEWKGGECPVDKQAVVRVWFEDKENLPYGAIGPAYLWNWQHESDFGYDIITFEIVGEGSLGE